MRCPILTTSLDLYTVIMIHDMSYIDYQPRFITVIMIHDMSYIDYQPRFLYCNNDTWHVLNQLELCDMNQVLCDWCYVLCVINCLPCTMWNVLHIVCKKCTKNSILAFFCILSIWTMQIENVYVYVHCPRS